jgi:pimeloyl-ACP methyl ester carboxylesterase
MPDTMNGAVRIHYEVAGSGPPLLLHTGFGLAAREWYDLGYVAALARDYRLILLDPRGQGASDKPHATEAYTPEHRVADVIAVLDALALDRTHFWGYSLGGRVGWELAVHRPERLSSLVLGGARPVASPPNRAWAELLGQGMPAFLGSVEAAMSPFPPPMHARFLANDTDALAAATLVERPSLEAHLGAIELPTLVYCGDRDAPYEGARHAAAAMPNATFASLAGLNHVDAFLASDVVLPHARAFLAGLAGRRAPATGRAG